MFLSNISCHDAEKRETGNINRFPLQPKIKGNKLSSRLWSRIQPRPISLGTGAALLEQCRFTSRAKVLLKPDSDTEHPLKRMEPGTWNFRVEGCGLRQLGLRVGVGVYQEVSALFAW